MNQIAREIYRKFETSACKLELPGDGVLSNGADTSEYEICACSEDLEGCTAADGANDLYLSYCNTIALHYGMLLNNKFNSPAKFAGVNLNSLSYMLRYRASKPDVLCGYGVISALAESNNIKYKHSRPPSKITKICGLKNSILYNAEFIRDNNAYIMDSTTIDVAHELVESTSNVPVRIIVRIKTDMSTILAYQLT